MMSSSGLRKFLAALLIGAVPLLSACSTNPATGESQFDAFMPRESEAAIGAQQHAEIVREYGGVYNDPALQSYVSEIGQKVARNTERPEVQYKFTLLDSPVVNAFALPGGYVYVTRGLMAAANDEAEFASVLGHEVGHVTARHQASRYSQGILTNLGAAVIGAAVGNPNLSRALGVGSDLYISSYSRDQENQADMLGIRYLDRAGYDPRAMSDFLSAMGHVTAAESRLDGKEQKQFSYLSSHPQTGDRVGQTARIAAGYPPRQTRNRDAYLAAIDGMTYGDSADQGFVRGTSFFHPGLGFAFTLPAGYKIVNQPDAVAAQGRDGTVVVLDMAPAKGVSDPAAYMMQDWLRGGRIDAPERLTINGMDAATASFPGVINGRPVELRAIAIAWSRDRIVRLQMAIPQGVSARTVEDLKRATYSFRRLSADERASIHPRRIEVIVAAGRDTQESLARRMAVDRGQLEMFRALNNLTPGSPIIAGQKYKIVS